jgi:hypothetical protein
VRVPSQDLLRAQLRLLDLVHAADVHHEGGNSLTPRQLLALAQACADVSRILGRPWLLEELASPADGRASRAPVAKRPAKTRKANKNERSGEESAA